MQAYNMSNKGYIRYNGDMDLVFFILTPIAIAGLIVMWMYESVDK